METVGNWSEATFAKPMPYNPSTEPFLRTEEMYALVTFVVAFSFVIAMAFINSSVPHTKARLGARLAISFVATLALIQPMVDYRFRNGFESTGFLIMFGLFSATYAGALLLEWANGIFRR